MFLTLLSCAASSHYARIEIPGAYTDTRSLEQAAEEMTWAEAEDVEVLVGVIPEGMHVEEGVLVIDDTERYELRAKVSTTPKGATANFLGVWWYDYPEDQAGKRKLCAWQVPLNWVTLTTWGWYTPFYYPCRVYETNEPDSLAARRDRLVATMRTGAKATGANLVVITGMGSLVTIDAGSGATVGTLEAWQASGYAFLDRQQE